VSSELQEYLSGSWSHRIPFQKDEFTEPLLQVYVTVQRCMEHGADCIQVTNKNIAWIKSGRVIHKFEGLYADCRSLFEQVRARDEVIGRHLKVIQRSEDSITYEIA
jgi:hypothetical protein